MIIRATVFSFIFCFFFRNIKKSQGSHFENECFSIIITSHEVIIARHDIIQHQWVYAHLYIHLNNNKNYYTKYLYAWTKGRSFLIWRSIPLLHHQLIHLECIYFWMTVTIKDLWNDNYCPCGVNMNMRVWSTSLHPSLLFQYAVGWWPNKLMGIFWHNNNNNFCTHNVERVLHYPSWCINHNSIYMILF